MSQDATRLEKDARGIPVQIGLYPSGSRHVAFNSSGAVVCTALDAGVSFVEVTVTQNAFITIGSNTMVNTDGFYQAAQFPRIYAIRDFGPSGKAKFTVIGAQGGAAGVFHLTQFK